MGKRCKRNLPAGDTDDVTLDYKTHFKRIQATIWGQIDTLDQPGADNSKRLTLCKRLGLYTQVNTTYYGKRNVQALLTAAEKGAKYYYNQFKADHE